MNTPRTTIADIFSPYLSVGDTGAARIHPEYIDVVKKTLFSRVQPETPLVVSESWNALQKNGELVDFFANDSYYVALQPQDNKNQIQLLSTKNNAAIVISLECFLNAFHAASIN